MGSTIRRGGNRKHMAVTRTVSLSKEQDDFLDEHDISPSELFQEAVDRRREKLEQ